MCKIWSKRWSAEPETGTNNHLEQRVADTTDRFAVRWETDWRSLKRATPLVRRMEWNGVEWRSDEYIAATATALRATVAMKRERELYAVSLLLLHVVACCRWSFVRASAFGLTLQEDGETLAVCLVSDPRAFHYLELLLLIHKTCLSMYCVLGKQEYVTIYNRVHKTNIYFI